MQLQVTQSSYQAHSQGSLAKKEGGRERTLGVRLVTQSIKTKTHFLHRFMTFKSNRSNREETYSFAGYKFALSILVFTFYSVFAVHENLK